jgi:hypothetical protein
VEWWSASRVFSVITESVFEPAMMAGSDVYHGQYLDNLQS